MTPSAAYTHAFCAINIVFHCLIPIAPSPCSVCTVFTWEALDLFNYLQVTLALGALGEEIFSILVWSLMFR